MRLKSVATFGGRLQYLRRQHCLTTRELGVKVNYSQSNISKLEARTEPPPLEVMETLDSYFQVGLDYWYGRGGQTLKTAEYEEHVRKERLAYQQEKFAGIRKRKGH